MDAIHHSHKANVDAKRDSPEYSVIGDIIGRSSNTSSSLALICIRDGMMAHKTRIILMSPGRASSNTRFMMLSMEVESFI